MFCNLTHKWLGIFPSLPWSPLPSHSFGRHTFFFLPQGGRNTAANVTSNIRPSNLNSTPPLASHSTAICGGSPSSSSALRDAAVILLYANVPFSPAQPFIYSFFYFSLILKSPLQVQPGGKQREREKKSHVTVITIVEHEPPPHLSVHLLTSRCRHFLILG